MNGYRRAALWGTLFFAVACTGTEPTASDAPPSDALPERSRYAVLTDRSEYALRPGAFGPETTIVTTIRAENSPIYIANCNGAPSLGLERQEREQWVQAWVTEVNACLSAPIVVRPGGEHGVTITPVSRAEARDLGQRTEARLEAGTYRVVWYGVFLSFDMNANPSGEELPLDQRVSAPFTIRRHD